MPPGERDGQPPATARAGTGARCRRGQVDPERRSLAGLRLDGDVAARLADDAVAGREPEPCPLADLLGRVEGVEGVAPDLVAHPEPRVRHREHGDPARVGDVQPGGQVRPIEPRRAEQQRAAIGHRIACVDRQVHEDLLDLGAVHAHAPGSRIEARHDRDALAEEALEHRLDAEHDRVEVHVGRREHGLAREPQELACELGGPVGRELDRLDLAAGPALGSELDFEHGGRPDDRREHVVEVMGDPARETADGLELLGLEQLRLEAHPRRDVDHLGDRADDPTSPVANGRQVERDVEGRAIPAPAVELPVIHGGAREHAAEDLGQLVAGARRECVDLAAEHVAAGPAGERLRGSVPELHPSVVVEEDHRDRRCGEDRLQAGRRIADESDGAAPLDDDPRGVAQRAEQPQRRRRERACAGRPPRGDDADDDVVAPHRQDEHAAAWSASLEHGDAAGPRRDGGHAGWEATPDTIGGRSPGRPVDTAAAGPAPRRTQPRRPRRAQPRRPRRAQPRRPGPPRQHGSAHRTRSGSLIERPCRSGSPSVRPRRGRRSGPPHLRRPARRHAGRCPSPARRQRRASERTRWR